jgi:hypothetical protein
VALRAGRLTDRAAHDHAWGDAEQTATDWGVTMAGRRGQRPTDVQNAWFPFTQLYRFALRNRPALLDLPVPIPFYDWATDVRTDVPGHLGGEAFYRLATLHLVGVGQNSTALLAAYLQTLLIEVL